MSDILRPNVGDILSYRYRDDTGTMQVTKTTRRSLEFLDTYLQIKNQPISFNWSTWEVHVTSTLRDVTFVNRKPTWEV